MKNRFPLAIFFAATAAMPAYSAVQAQAGTAGRTANTRPHSVLLSAQRALLAAETFLGKAPDDPAGDREAALKSVEAALTDVNAQLAKTAPR